MQQRYFLPNEWYADYYEVRAYTRCMLNFGEGVVFSRVFPVMDAIGYDKNRRTQAPGYDFQQKRPANKESGS